MNKDIYAVPVNDNDGITLQKDTQLNSNSPVTLEQEKGEIKTTTETRQFTVSSGSNHNEIKILESDWDEICRKAKAISFKKRIDWTSLMWGVAIPLFLETIVEKRAGENPDYLPLVICLLLIIFTTSSFFQRIWRIISKLLEALTSGFLKWLGDNIGIVQISDGGNEDENRVHHQDLLNAIDKISQQRKKELDCGKTK